MLCRVLILFALVCSAVTSCSDSRESVTAIGNWYLVRGTLNLPEGAFSSARFFAIDRDNRRQAITSTVWDEASRSFSFKVLDSDFNFVRPNTLESELSMGKSVRAPPLGDLSVAELHIEALLPTQEQSADGSLVPVRFAQFRLKYDSLARVSGGQLFDLGTVETRVGYSAQVQLVDEKGDRLRQSEVAYIPFSRDLVESSDTPWKSVNYAPVMLTTDDEGRVTIEPIFLEFPEMALYLVHPSGCRMVSPRVLLAGLANSPEVAFPTCENESAIAGTSTLRAAYREPERLVLTASSHDESLDSAPFLYTNQPVARLKLWATEAQAMQPFRIEVFATDDAASSPVVSEDFKFFLSSVNVDLPVIFTTDRGASSANGRFLIKVSFLGTDKQELLLRGRLQVTRPTAIGDNQLVVENLVDQVALVGGEAEFLRVESSFCSLASDSERRARKVGVTLGDVITSANLLDLSCPSAGGQLTFSLSALIESASVPPSAGGFSTLRYALRDAYGNWSEDDILNNRNTREIYFDFGKADLQARPFVFGREVGLTSNLNNFTTHPYCSFVYPNCVANAGSTVWSLATGGVVFRFQSEDACQTEPVSGDGTSAVGSRVKSYFLQLNDSLPDLSEGSAVLSMVRSCTETFDMSLLTVPTPTGGEPVVFYLFVIDHAGNIAIPQRIEVSACASSRTSGNVCWQN